MFFIASNAPESHFISLETFVERERDRAKNKTVFSWLAMFWPRGAKPHVINFNSKFVENTS